MAPPRDDLDAPMLDSSAPSDEPREGLSYALDHTEYTLDTSEITCETGQMWLAVFVGSGILLPMLYELLYLHAGVGVGKTYSSFLVPFLGYCGQALVGFVWVLAHGTWRQGSSGWSRRMVGFMVLSSLGNGLAQALDYIAVTHAGVMLYVILHSSTTFFACIISVLALRTRITPVQWVGVGAVVAGLVLTGVPTPIDATRSWGVGVAAALGGALSLAASYPFAELVFLSARSAETSPSEEFCSFAGSLINVAAFAVWTAVYTAPRWEELVVAPIAAAPYPASYGLVAAMYAAHALMVGLHTLAFWKVRGRARTPMARAPRRAPARNPRNPDPGRTPPGDEVARHSADCRLEGRTAGGHLPPRARALLQRGHARVHDRQPRQQRPVGAHAEARVLRRVLHRLLRVRRHQAEAARRARAHAAGRERAGLSGTVV